MSIVESSKVKHSFSPSLRESYNDEIIISIIIDCYHGLNYIKESIESVIRQEHKNVELMLIDNGANLKAKAPNSWTPLYEAVLIGHMETVKLLIENGANVNAKDQMGGTPLDQVQNEEIIDYLMNHIH